MLGQNKYSPRYLTTLNGKWWAESFLYSASTRTCRGFFSSEKSRCASATCGRGAKRLRLLRQNLLHQHLKSSPDVEVKFRACFTIKKFMVLRKSQCFRSC